MQATIDQIKLQLHQTTLKLDINEYVEYILNIFLVRDGIRSACILELLGESQSVVNIFISFITNIGCIYNRIGSDIYVMKEGTTIPCFSHNNFHTELGQFLGYPYYHSENFIKNKYRYYIRISIGDNIYNLYKMAAASKRHNSEARTLEDNCRKYFAAVLPNSCIIYGYTRKSMLYRH